MIDRSTMNIDSINTITKTFQLIRTECGSGEYTWNEWEIPAREIKDFLKGLELIGFDCTLVTTSRRLNCDSYDSDYYRGKYGEAKLDKLWNHISTCHTWHKIPLKMKHSRLYTEFEGQEYILPKDVCDEDYDSRNAWHITLEFHKVNKIL